MPGDFCVEQTVALAQIDDLSTSELCPENESSIKGNVSRLKFKMSP